MKRSLLPLALLLAACEYDSAWEPRELGPLPPPRGGEPPRSVEPVEDAWYPVDPQTVAMLAGDRGFEVFAGVLANREAWVAADQARRAMWPVLRPHIRFFTLDGETQATEGQFVDVDKQNLALGAGIALSLDVVEARTRVLSTRQTALATEKESEAARRVTILAASELFDELLRAQNDLAITRELLAGASSVADLERAREAQGAGLRADRLRAEALEAEAEGDVVRAQAVFRDNSTQLAVALRMDPGVTLYAPLPEVEPFELFPEDAELDPLIGEALETRPELAAAVLRIEAAEEELRGARLGPWFPSIFAAAGVDGFGQNFGSLKDREQVALGLTWDLSPTRFGRPAEVRVQVARERLNLAWGAEGIRAAVVRTFQVLLASREALRSARRQVEASQAALTVVQERRAAGAALVVELLGAQRELALARRLLLDTILAHNRAQRRLHFAVGR